MTKQQIAEIEGPLSAAESACSAKERRFVYWLLNLPPKTGFRVRAARLAGFGAKFNSSAHTINSITQVLLGQQRIIDLIVEVTRKQIRSSAPEALAAVKEILADPTHRDRLKAAQVVLERIEPTMQRIDVSVKHEVVDRDGEAVAYLRKLKELGVERSKMEEELGYSDLPRYERLLELEDAKRAAAPVIDVEYTIVGDQQ
jgi:hypothetical protein